MYPPYPQTGLTILTYRLSHLVRDLTKVGILLSAFESACQPLHYYALDLGLPNLRRTLSLLPEYTHVTVHGLYGTFDDGLRWISTLGSADSNHIDISSPPPQKLLLSLGATLGNISRDGCADFLSRFASTLDEKDLMLVSLDGTQDPALISNAYNDSEDINRAFNSNALDHANMVLGGEIFKDGEWETVGTWNKQQGRHEWGYRFRGGDNQNDWKWDGLRVKKGEKILGILSWNYDERQCGELWGQSGMRCIRRIGVEGRGEKGPKHCECCIISLFYWGQLSVAADVLGSSC